MKLNFIWIGKPKYKHTTEAVELYHKRLKHYTKINIIELKDVKINRPTDQKLKEGELFDKHINNKSYSICLHEKGRELSSIEFAQLLNKLQNAGHQNVNIMIGGAFGFTNNVLSNCNYKLSLSKMTLPHDLCRVVLLEQVYRAFTILKNEKYHNP